MSLNNPAATLFHNIIAASVTGNLKSAPKKKVQKKKA